MITQQHVYNWIWFAGLKIALGAAKDQIRKSSKDNCSEPVLEAFVERHLGVLPRRLN